MFTYSYPISSTATGDINCEKLEYDILESDIENTFSYLLKENGNGVIAFETELSESDESALGSLVSNHAHITTAESLLNYLLGSVFPFTRDLIAEFAAENIAMGVTQTGKTADILGLFEKKYTLSGVLHPVSLKASFDTGSLYVSTAIIEHVRDNPTEFDGLSPYVTDTRLLAMKNKIEFFLGITLTN